LQPAQNGMMSSGDVEHVGSMLTFVLTAGELTDCWFHREKATPPD